MNGTGLVTTAREAMNIASRRKDHAEQVHAEGAVQLQEMSRHSFEQLHTRNYHWYSGPAFTTLNSCRRLDAAFVSSPWQL